MWFVTLFVAIMLCVIGVVGMVKKDPNSWLTLMLGLLWVKVAMLEMGAGLLITHLRDSTS